MTALREVLANPPEPSIQSPHLWPTGKSSLGIVVICDESNDLLARTLASIFEQSAACWKVVVVDTNGNLDLTAGESGFESDLADKVHLVTAAPGDIAQKVQQVLSRESCAFITIVRPGDRLAPDFVREAIGLLELTGAEAFLSGRMESSLENRVFRLVEGISDAERPLRGARWVTPNSAELQHKFTDPRYAGKVMSKRLVDDKMLSWVFGKSGITGFENLYPQLYSARGVCGTTRGLYIEHSAPIDTRRSRSDLVGDIVTEVARVVDANHSAGDSLLTFEGVNHIAAILLNQVTVDRRPDSNAIREALSENFVFLNKAPDPLVVQRLKTEISSSSSVEKRESRSKPLVSMIVPVRDRRELFGDFLTSIASQWRADFELVVVVDPQQETPFGDTVAQVDEVVRATVVPSPFPGAGPARNFGAKNAMGKYLWFVDSDDLIPPTGIDAVAARAQDEGVDIMLFQAEHFAHPHGESSIAEWFLRDEGLQWGERVPTSEISHRLLQLTSPSPWNLIVRREFFASEELSFDNLPSSNDLRCVMSALAVARDVALYDDVIYRYRRLPLETRAAGKDQSSLPRALRGLRRGLIRRGLFPRLFGTYQLFLRRVLARWCLRGQPVSRCLVLIRDFPELWRDVFWRSPMAHPDLKKAGL